MLKICQLNCKLQNKSTLYNTLLADPFFLPHSFWLYLQCLNIETIVPFCDKIRLNAANRKQLKTS